MKASSSGTAVARLAASTTVAKNNFPLRSIAALLYRMLELTASAALPAGACWIVDPKAMLPFFVLFWYLPAAMRAKSITKPLTQPILCFIVDDVSLLGLHPSPRPAKMSYAIAVIRIPVLFAILLLSSTASPLPQDMKDLVINHNAAASLHKELFNDALHSFISLSICVSVIACAVLWAIITVYLLFTPVFAGVSNSDLLGQVSAIEGEVQEASNLEPPACKAQMESLKTQHPKLPLTNLFNTIGPAWACVLHLGMDIGFVVSLISHDKKGIAIPLTICLCLSLFHLWRGTDGPINLPLEVQLSLKRGLATDNWLDAISADKAVLRIPETVLKIYALPFVAKNLIKVLTSAGATFANLALVGKFVYTTFDLGVESFGMSHAEKLDAKKKD